MKLTKKEQKEPLFVTWGRILTIARNYVHNERLLELAEKLNKDLGSAKIEENYFKGI